MSGFQGYDQWKTASPYDDEDDTRCAYCGMDLPDDVTDYTDADENAVMDGFCNVECEKLGSGGEISPRYGLPHPTVEQQKSIKALWHHLHTWRRDHVPKPTTFEEVTECNFPEGDFKWDNNDPGDGHVYCCGERDCPVQWHEVFYCETIERKDGKLSIEIHEGDSDGNWDICAAWEEGEDWDASGVGYHFGESHLRDYFYHWAEYWLDAVETGKDPCDQTMTRPQKQSEWVDFCIKAAQNNVDALPIYKPGMQLKTIGQVRNAVNAGQKVHWVNTGYTVIKDSVPQYLIAWHYGQQDVNYVGLGSDYFEEEFLKDNPFFIAEDEDED